ncbi:MAG: hypothetical protein IV090_25160 [Candidatus Sericytochromatia bacterium]|nr:hypothetical protein [Candidatus Sericytochromatia bacterium]
MKGVIIFQDNQISENLIALMPGQSPWLLPVSGKPILEFQLETLACMGIREVLMIGAGPSISRKYGQGQSLGLQLDYAPAVSNLDLSLVLRRNLQFVTGHDLVLIQGLKLTLPQHAPHCLRLTGSQRLGEGVYALSAKELPQILHDAKNLNDLPLNASLDIHPITDAQSYLAGHFWLAEKGLNGLSLPAYGQKQGVLIGSQLQIPADLSLMGPGLIADGCKLARGVQLEQVWLGKGVVVGPGTHLKRCVVLPGTWIGPGLSLADKLVSGQTLLDISADSLVEIEESAWLDHIDPPFQRDVSSRVFAGLLWALQTPFQALLQSEWSSQDPRWQDLRDRWSERLHLELRPKMWQVATGQMALVGQPPVAKGERSAYLDYVPGALPYSDFLGSQGEQAELDNACYPLIRNSGAELKMALKILSRSLTTNGELRQDRQ